MSCCAASMDVHTAQVQAAVQRLVMEHGEYMPLELLLATNRLGYEDYQAWREGRLETLDAILADGKRETRAWLEGAQSWADVLGLAAEPAVHDGWENNAGTVLVVSADPRLNALLSTRFRGVAVGCGGWTRRRSFITTQCRPDRDCELLAPGREPARVRAMYTDPNHARRSISAASYWRPARTRRARPALPKANSWRHSQASRSTWPPDGGKPSAPSLRRAQGLTCPPCGWSSSFCRNRYSVPIHVPRRRRSRQPRAIGSRDSTWLSPSKRSAFATVRQRAGYAAHDRMSKMREVGPVSIGRFDVHVEP